MTARVRSRAGPASLGPCDADRAPSGRLQVRDTRDVGTPRILAELRAREDAGAERIAPRTADLALESRAEARALLCTGRVRASLLERVELSTLCTGTSLAQSKVNGEHASFGCVDRPRDHTRTLRPVNGETESGEPDSPSLMRRICARRGCTAAVKKATAKYCSVRCCAIDPERHARLRLSAQRSNRRVLPMSRQLSLGLSPTNNPEAALSRISESREDVPQGMSRLCS